MRPDLEAGGEPLGKILELAESVGPGESFVLLAPFEPVPLYRLLSRRGFAADAEPLGDGSFRVTFRRNA